MNRAFLLGGLVVLILWVAAIAPAAIPQLKIQNPQKGGPAKSLGSAIAIDGGTMVAGAPSTTVNGLTAAGLARVYRSTGSGEWQLETQLAPDVSVANMFFGSSVAISGDTAAVGAPMVNAVLIYTRTNGIWSQQAKILGPVGSVFFGCSVSLSGETLGVGATNGVTASGRAYIYTRSGVTWTQQATLTPAGSVDDDWVGMSIAVEGNTAVVGAPGDNDGIGGPPPPKVYESGAAYIFTRSGTVWTQQAKLKAASPVDYERFGDAVSISGDTVVVGGYRDTGSGLYPGAAYVFTRAGTSWTQQQKLTAADGAAADHYGKSVSVSADTLVIGAEAHDEVAANSGCAYVYTRSGAVWSLQGKVKEANSAAGDLCGNAVAISGDQLAMGVIHDDYSSSSSGSAVVFSRTAGVWSEVKKFPSNLSSIGDGFGNAIAVCDDTAVIGANYDSTSAFQAGIAYIFTKSNGVWTQQAELRPSGLKSRDHFGDSVSISGDTVVVGAPWGDTESLADCGAAYIFTRSGTVWTQQARLTAPTPVASDDFGYSVAISGDTIAIGADGDDEGGSGTGAVYVFTRSAEVWTQQAKIKAADLAQSKYLGESVAISGDTILAGSISDQQAGSYAGAAYVFTRTGTQWSQQDKLLASDGASMDMFGSSVSVSGDTAVIGALGDSDLGTMQGSAYVFHRSGAVWTEQQKLTANDAAAGDGFGYPVSIWGSLLIAGASAKDSGTTYYMGAAYIFKNVNGVWSQIAKLTAADGVQDDNFGCWAAIHKGTAVCGAVLKDDPDQDSGAAYVFDLSNECAVQESWQAYR